MGSETRTSIGQITVIVSNDRLKAWIHQPQLADPDYQPPTIDEMMSALETAGIALNESVRERVTQFAALMTETGEDAEGPLEIPVKFLIAEGRAAVNARNGTFEWYEQFQQAEKPADNQEPVDYFSISTIKTVEANVAIGRLEPPVHGVVGRDVFGNQVQPKSPKGMAVKLGHGTHLADDGREVITDVAGRVFYERRTVWVDEVLEINGDVNFDSGSLDVCLDINVHGTVRSNFSVRTTKSLIVDKAIEAAEVDVAGDITVHGGICGHECTGKIRAGGDIIVRFCNESKVDVAGDFRFKNETLNSQINTTAHLVSKRGTIIGGQVWAREGIEVGTLGNDVGVLTRVAVGIPIDTLRRARRMEQDVKELAKGAKLIRQKIYPLIANEKRLTHEQREATTELMDRADDLEVAVENIKTERKQLLESMRPRETPFILGHEKIHPGVRIAIGARETRVIETIPGPVRVGLRKINGVTEIVAVDQETGSVTILPSMEIDLDAPLETESDAEGGADGTD